MSPCSPQIARSQICVSVGGVDVCVLRGPCVYVRGYELGKSAEAVRWTATKLTGPSAETARNFSRNEVRAALPWRTDRLSRCVARTLPRARHPALAERPASCLRGTSHMRRAL
jgi:hypothetical protein